MEKRNQDKQANREAFTVKTLDSIFIDELANISINPNGSCRLNFISWSTDENGKPRRVDSELILTMQTLKVLASSLPKAINNAEKIITTRTLKEAKVKHTIQ